MDAIERAKDIVNASEWVGDMGVNMTTLIGAGRCLAKRVVQLEASLEAIIKHQDMVAGELSQVSAVRLIAAKAIGEPRKPKWTTADQAKAEAWDDHREYLGRKIMEERRKSQ